MKYIMPRWIERQPVNTYYEDTILPERSSYSIQRIYCGICYVRFRKGRGFKNKKIKSTEIKTKIAVYVGNKTALFHLNMAICTGCHEKYKLKSSEQNLNIERKYLSENNSEKT